LSKSRSDAPKLWRQISLPPKRLMRAHRHYFNPKSFDLPETLP
jgi:hypothetical protein